MRLTPEQVRVVCETVRQYGTLALAAQNAGIAPSFLRRCMNEDEDLRIEIEDSLDIFKDVLRMEVLKRSVKSDAMLKLAAEGFVPETFNAGKDEKNKRNKPTGLLLRQFNDAGEEVGVAGKQQSGAPVESGPQRMIEVRLL